MKWQDFDYNKWKEEESKYDHAQLNKDWEKARATSNELEKFMTKFVEIRKGKQGPPFKPEAHYNKTGDIFEVILSNEQYYAQWLCPSITILLSQETHEVVGVQIWGVKYLIEKEYQK